LFSKNWIMDYNNYFLYLHLKENKKH